MIDGDLERRKDLCYRKQKYSERVSEIRTILGVKRGVQFFQIKGDTCKRPEYKEWKIIVGRLRKLESEINKIPHVGGQSMSDKIVNILKENHPHIFDECIELARKAT